MPDKNIRNTGFRAGLLLTFGVAIVAGAGQILAEDILRLRADLAPLVLAPAALALLVLAFRRPWILASTQTSVCLIAAVALGCVLGTLVVQKTDVDDPLRPDPEKSFRTFALAEATFLVKSGDLLAGLVGAGDAPGLTDSDLERTGAARRRFGDRVGNETEARLRKRLDDLDDKRRSAAMVDDHESTFRSLYAFVSRIRINSIFLSFAFNALLATIALSIVILLFRRWPYRGQLGFALTHLGIVVVLVGALLSSVMIDRGFLSLEEGEASSSYFSLTRGQAMRFEDGLSVGVRSVDKSYWHQLFVAFPEDEIENAYLVLPGRTYEVDGGRVRIELGRYRPDALVGFEAFDRPDGPARPGYRVEVRDPAGTHVGWLVAGLEAQHDTWSVGEDGPLLTLRRESGEAKRRTWTEIAPTPELGSIRIEGADGDSGEIEVTRGLEQRLGDTRIRILEVARDVAEARRGVPFERQSFRRPGLHLEVDGPTGVERRWIERGETTLTREPDLRARFDWPRLEPGEVRIVHGDPATVVFDGPAGTETQPLRLDEPLLLADGRTVVVRRRLDSYDLRPAIQDGAAPTAEGNLALRVGVLDVTVTTPAGTETGRLISGSAPDRRVFEDMTVTAADGTPVSLTLRATSERDYRTGLVIRRPGEPDLAGTLRVNRPVRRAGYRIYQTDMEEGESPTWSTMQVVRDPGIPVVYFGLGLTFLGVVWLLLIEPARRAKRIRRSAAARTPSPPTTVPPTEVTADVR